MMQTEKQFQAQVIELARLCGWLIHAERPARTKDGWATPIQGDAGWPDLVLALDGRLICAELKSEGGKVTASQAAWLETLRGAGVEVYVWRPSDFDSIVEILK